VRRSRLTVGPWSDAAHRAVPLLRDKATVFNLLSWWHGKRVQAEVRWSGRPEQAHRVTTTRKIVATDRTDANETCGTRTLSWRRAGTVAGAMGGE